MISDSVLMITVECKNDNTFNISRIGSSEYYNITVAYTGDWDSTCVFKVSIYYGRYLLELCLGTLAYIDTCTFRDLLMKVAFNSFNGIRNIGVQAMAIILKTIVIFNESFAYYFDTS